MESIQNQQTMYTIFLIRGDSDYQKFSWYRTCMTELKHLFREKRNYNSEGWFLIKNIQLLTYYSYLIIVIHQILVNFPLPVLHPLRQKHPDQLWSYIHFQIALHQHCIFNLSIFSFHLLCSHICQCSSYFLRNGSQFCIIWHRRVIAVEFPIMTKLELLI